MSSLLQKLKITEGNEFFKILIIIFLDFMAIAISYTAVLWARFDFHFGSIDPVFLENLFPYITLTAVTSIVVFYSFRLYHSVWSYAGMNEVLHMGMAYLVLIPILLLEHVFIPIHLPISVYLGGFVISFFLCTSIRMMYRIARIFRNRIEHSTQKGMQNVMIIGGGAAGGQLIYEFRNSKHLHGHVRCVIDDNPQKKGKFIEGVRIVGNRRDIPAMVEKYGIQRIILAIPTLNARQRSEILSYCKDLGCQVQSLPGIYQLVRGQVHVSQLRNINVAELLGREEIHVNGQEILETAKGKTILITGGGGSIGSELCRQIAAAEPKCLIIFDIYENNAYAIQQELQASYPELQLVTLIGSVRDRDRLADVFRTYRPDTVFHAAAHKHVPLMEDSPNEAIKNNVLGTLNTAICAEEYGAKKMVLISTDKAVNPTNVMGASKRICEMIIQSMSRLHPSTKFVAVRFGNVLGSNGSVIPLFEKQIAAGGPVTVTDKNIIRYFMTIPEAVSLILQAGYYARGGEIFVLDMGDPVKIDDMARALIRMSGYIPDVDIPIKYIGLRPGEKLYEELLMDEEGLQKTGHDRIFVGKPIPMDDKLFHQQLRKLILKCEDNSDDIRDFIQEIVPTFRPSDESSTDDRKNTAEEPYGETSASGVPENRPTANPEYASKVYCAGRRREVFSEGQNHYYV